jgi:hypothetical protein
VISPADFRKAFDSYTDSVFRLETLQTYAEPDEAAVLAAFSSGQRRPPDPSKDQWLAAVRSAVNTGRVMQRVHVIREPLSDYLRYELTWSYGPNAAAGEDIRIIPIPAGAPWPKDLPRQDFWLFDNSRLYVQHYTPTGTWIGVERCTNQDHIAAARRWRADALRLGVPWQTYTAQRPELAEPLQRAS